MELLEAFLVELQEDEPVKLMNYREKFSVELLQEFPVEVLPDFPLELLRTIGGSLRDILYGTLKGIPGGTLRGIPAVTSEEIHGGTPYSNSPWSIRVRNQTLN